MFCQQQHRVQNQSLKETNNLFLNFLWDNKGEKIKQTEVIADYQHGGKDARDNRFNKALKISWILKYTSTVDRLKL